LLKISKCDIITLMKKPLVAIVGRPNVGKSTFFNKIAGKRISIIKDEPGVTRDRIYADCVWLDNAFTLVDTGGIDLKNNSEVQQNIMIQAKIAIELADIILFFVDGKEGLTSADFEVSDFLRKTKKPIILVVNKLDNNEVEKSYDFYELNMGMPFVISSEQSKGLGDLLDEVVSYFPHESKINDADLDKVKIAIVGKPNAGKSSLVNKLLGEERVIVSPVAGTTRDAIDVPFNYNKQKFVLIDTAGMRRKRSIDDETVERYSIFRTIDSVKRADVVVVVIDVSTEISEQDVKICALAYNENKPIVIAMNKWDLIDKSEKNTDERASPVRKGTCLKIRLVIQPFYRFQNPQACFFRNLDTAVARTQNFRYRHGRHTGFRGNICKTDPPGYFAILNHFVSPNFMKNVYLSVPNATHCPVERSIRLTFSARLIVLLPGTAA